MINEKKSAPISGSEMNSSKISDSGSNSIVMKTEEIMSKKMNSLDLEEISLESQKPKLSISNPAQSDSGITKMGLICVTTLCVINLMNYMDRYTIAGVLNDVKKYYEISDAEAGFLQTVFMIFYLICAPIFGFMGDRYNRKWIMVIGLCIWVLAVFGSTFIPKNDFYAFMVLRGIVGVGEASYATIAPTLIADMFTGVTRSRVLMVFYFAIPVGSGLGYVVGSFMDNLTGHWQWGVRVTPIGGIACILALIFIIQEPVRGAAEQQLGAKDATSHIKSSYLDDIKYLLSIKTFLLSNVGYTLVVFATGTLAWWVPSSIEYSTWAKDGYKTIKEAEDHKDGNSSLIFGALTCAGGIFGVSIGIFASQIWKEGKFCCQKFKTDRADPLVCAIGSFAAIPFMLVGLHLIDSNPIPAWIGIFLAVTFLSLNWAVVVDILLYIIVPRRRNFATAWQISLSHLFGDASGPYIIGIVSDSIRGNDDSPKAHFDSLMKSFYIPSALLVISGVTFLLSAITIIHDKDIFEQAMGYRKKSAKVADVSFMNGHGSGLETSKL